MRLIKQKISQNCKSSRDSHVPFSQLPNGLPVLSSLPSGVANCFGAAFEAHKEARESRLSWEEEEKAKGARALSPENVNYPLPFVLLSGYPFLRAGYFLLPSCNMNIWAFYMPII